VPWTTPLIPSARFLSHRRQSILLPRLSCLFKEEPALALGTISLLERVLLYGFILQGQYGAIGLVIPAKAFTRFKAPDDRSVAEYVLIGTLLSGGLALLFGLLVVRGLAR
jgi:hypothetical protein